MKDYIQKWIFERKKEAFAGLDSGYFDHDGYVQRLREIDMAFPEETNNPH